MISINNKKYNIDTIRILYGNYFARQDGKKREGISPIICFQCDKFYFRIETIYDKEWLNEMNFDTITDISKYISDISYEDEKGWLSLSYGNYKCMIKKIENKVFNIELICECEEVEEAFEIYLNENINI